MTRSVLEIVVLGDVGGVGHGRLQKTKVADPFGVTLFLNPTDAVSHT
jgi:hypothetical protein